MSLSNTNLINHGDTAFQCLRRLRCKKATKGFVPILFEEGINY